jgi:pSer/pThr/pTyr-binding forkhead associated (FHA) protein
MRDGLTKKTEGGGRRVDALERFLAERQATLVQLDGPNSGASLRLAGVRVTFGRGPAVDHLVDDGSISRQHACFELTERGYRVRDLGSTNGVVVNGSKVPAAELESGDEIRLGDVRFKYVVEARVPEPGTYELSAE